MANETTFVDYPAPETFVTEPVEITGTREAYERPKFSKQDLDDFFYSYSDIPGGPEVALAKSLANQAAFKFPEMFDYQKLKSGEHLVPSREGHNFTDREIIQLLAADSEGNDLEIDVSASDALIRGIARELPAAAAAYKAFGPGYEATRKFMGPVTDLSKVAENVYKPAKIVSKFGDNLFPITGGIISSLVAAYGAKEATDLILGEEQPMFGDARAVYEGAKTGTAAAFFALAPYQLNKAFPKGLDLGLLQTTKNINEIKSLPDQLRVFDARPLLSLSRDELKARGRAIDLLQNPSVQSLISQGYKIRRISYGPNAGQYRAESRISDIKTNVFGSPYRDKRGGAPRIGGAYETMLNHWMKGAKEQPIRTGLIEGSIPLGMATTRYLVETPAGTEYDEFGRDISQTRPAGTGTVLLAEVTGGVTPGIAGTMIARRLPKVVNYLKSIYPEYKESQLAGLSKTDSVKRALRIDLKSGVQRDAMQALRDVMKAEGMSDEGIDATLNFGLQKAREAREQGLDLTIGQATGNPIILAYERLMGEELLTQASNAETAARQINKNSLLAVIEALDQGTPGQAKEGLQLASAIMEEGFASSLFNKLDATSQRLISSYDQLRKGVTDPEQAVELNRKFSRQFYGHLQNLVTQSKEAQNKAWNEAKNLGSNIVVTKFFDARGKELSRPNFYEAYVDLFSNVPGTRQEQQAKLKPIVDFVKEMSAQLNLPDPTVGRVVTTSVADTTDPLARFNFGKEVKPTDKKLGGITLPEGYRVFQRSEEVPGVAGKVTTTSVVDPNGNRVELTRDPENKIFPYGAEFIDGVKDTMQGKGQASELVAANNLAEAVNAVATTMSQGRVKFSRTPIDEVADSASQPPVSGAQPPSSTDGVVPVTVKDLLTIKSTVYNLAKDLKAGTNPNDPYYRLAKEFEYALLRDVESLEQNVSTQGKDFLVAYNMARALTNAHHDVFSRTFLSKFKQRGNAGESRVDPDMALDEVFGGNADATLVKLRDLDSTYAFMEEIGAVDEQIAGMEGAMQAYLRNIRANTMNSETGQPNMAKLREWLDQPENKEILARFPALENDLNDMQVVAKLLSTETKTATDSARRNNSLHTFAQIAGEGLFRRTSSQVGAESPQLVIGRAFKSDKPFQNLNRLLSQAELKGLSESQAQAYAEHLGIPFRGLDDLKATAKKGFEQAVLDFAFQNSGLYAKDPAVWNPMRTRELLFGKIPNGQVSLMEFLLGNNVIDQGKFNQIRDVLNSMSQLHAYKVSGKDLSDLYKTSGPILEMYAAITGSAIGTKSQQMLFGNVGPGSLVAAGKGAEAAKQLAIKIPEIMKVNALQELFENPELFITTMRAVKNVPRKSLVQKVGETLLDMGIAVPVNVAAKSTLVTPETPEKRFNMPETEEVEYDYPEPQASVQAPQQNLMAQRFARSQPTQVQPRPAAPAPVQPPMAAPAPPQGGANPQQRQQLAAMFPNDPILGAAGGIGSLFS